MKSLHLRAWVLISMLGTCLCMFADSYVWEASLYYRVVSEQQKTVEVSRVDLYNLEEDYYAKTVTVPETYSIYHGLTPTEYTVIGIGQGAFANQTKLEAIYLPETVTYIRDAAFLSCNNLKDVSLPSSLNTIGARAFNKCYNLKEITLPNHLNDINEESFANTGLDNIVLPEELEYIGKNAFSGTNITQITIPKRTIIAGGAFNGCTKLANIEVHPDCWKYKVSNGVLYSKDMTTVHTCPEAHPGNIELPSTITTIGSYAFYQCVNLKELTLPIFVTSISDAAFRGCSNLVEMKIPNRVTTLGREVFRECTKLSHVELPPYITSLRQELFFGCTNLTNIIIPDGITEIYPDVFNTTGITSIELPNSVETIGQTAFFNTPLSHIIIPNSLTTLQEAALSNTKLTEIKIPENVIYFGNKQFRICKYLKRAVLPPTVQQLNQTFIGCHALEEVNIPKSVTYIDKDCFKYCDNLRYIYSEIEEPFDSDVQFTNEILQNTILYIPMKTLPKYSKKTPWKKFWNIIEIDYSDIDNIESDSNVSTPVSITLSDGRICVDGNGATAVEVYDMIGKKLYHGNASAIPALEPGFYIVRVGSTIAKIRL